MGTACRAGAPARRLRLREAPSWTLGRTRSDRQGWLGATPRARLVSAHLPVTGASSSGTTPGPRPPALARGDQGRACADGRRRAADQRRLLCLGLPRMSCHRSSKQRGASGGSLSLACTSTIRISRMTSLIRIPTVNTPSQPVEDLPSRGQQEKVFRDLARNIKELLGPAHLKGLRNDPSRRQTRPPLSGPPRAQIRTGRGYTPSGSEGFSEQLQALLAEKIFADSEPRCIYLV